MQGSNAGNGIGAGTGVTGAAGGSATRRTDGVTLGLFSKIAAARKEKMTPPVSGSMTKPASSGPEQTSDKRQSTSHFPDIVDGSSAASSSTGNSSSNSSSMLTTGRAPVVRSSVAPKKVTARTFAQNLRWSKQSASSLFLDEMRAIPAVGSLTPHGQPHQIGATKTPLTPTPTAARTVERLQRRSVMDLVCHCLSTSCSFAWQWITRRLFRGALFLPASHSRAGHLRRAQDPLYANGVDPAANAGDPLLRRHSEWTSQHKPRTADSTTRGTSNASSKTSSASACHGDGGSDAPVHHQRQQQPHHHHHTVHRTGSLPHGDSGGHDNSNGQEQEIYFAETSEMPGVPIVYRNQKAKASNPERLNLDRRNLPVIPLLEGEQMLRLLNLQNNVIRRIDNLLGLPNLIFLDLYNNRVEKLENFQVVPNLRVLMLGKNRLRVIENLECLRKLDVLDLHSNEIEQMENLNDLVELRVLNLGGNRISVLENIDKLQLLTELNLRRNSIQKIGTLGRLPSLQRLFLSNNKIDSLDVLEPLFQQVSSISELRLDCNHVCDVNQAEYRSRLIKSFPALKHLDLKPLSEAERKDALQYFSQLKMANKEREELQDTQRQHAIAAARAAWDKRESALERQEHSRSTGALAVANGEPHRVSSNAASSWCAATSNQTNNTPKKPLPVDEPELKPTSREEHTLYNNKACFSEIEVHGEYRVLVIYGEAFEALESVKAHSLVNAITFRYVPIDRIMLAATASSSGNLKLFTRLRRLNFVQNDIRRFDQLLWLATLGTKAEEIFLLHNPVCSRSLLRAFIGARMSNVQRVNGEDITGNERALGKQLFQKPTRRGDSSNNAGYDATAALNIARKDTVLTRRPSRNAVGCTSYVVGEVVSAAVEMDRKCSMLEDAWEGLLASIVKETLQDIEQRDSFMAGCLEGL
ncbi:TPA: hypothetical protein N0F65_011022 [Lagenidium giganteum]|uniref:Leucine-rich repeat-containing protein 49 n=1 Tax=Lagenidium giganteum TaxID=4803 RepID=A0AAV2Z9G2_9STRA|nr:TPA: hypothetical protein N0F65_011022 [Lagenidium giganteum]